jgi:SAM-dependent methyltransferase
VDLPRSFTIRESSHRIHNPFTSDKLATLGQALSPPPGTRMLDLACATGEMLCTWARDHQVTGTGIDISTVFISAARARAAELGVDGRVSFVHGDASGYVADAPVGIASCVGATWIGGGVPGTVELLRRSLQPGGMMLIGGLASFLRTRLTGARLAGPSLPLDIGYSATIPPGIRTAVILRDHKCRWPGGCNQPAAACEVHHVKHKAHGGPTSLRECVLLCSFHHQVVIHRWGWTLVLNPDGTTTAWNPDRTKVLHSHGPPARAG